MPVTTRTDLVAPNLEALPESSTLFKTCMHRHRYVLSIDVKYKSCTERVYVLCSLLILDKL